MGLRVRRQLSPVARLTQPLAFADDRVNAFTDWTNRWLGWTWWPSARRPDPGRPIGADAHAAYLAQTLVFTLVAEWLMARFGALPSGRALWRDRVTQLVLTFLSWAVTTGAWERRARRGLRGFLPSLH